MWLRKSKIGDKEIPIRYVAIKLAKVFTHNSMVPIREMTMDSHKLEVNYSPSDVILWSLMFFKVLHDVVLLQESLDTPKFLIGNHVIHVVMVALL